MSHGTHQSDNRPVVSFKSSFWFVVILAGLFIAAVNFVNVMGNDEEHGAKVHEGAAGHTMEATSGQTLEGETGSGKPAGAETAADSTHTEGH